MIEDDDDEIDGTPSYFDVEAKADEEVPLYPDLSQHEPNMNINSSSNPDDEYKKMYEEQDAKLAQQLQQQLNIEIITICRINMILILV